MDNKEINPRIWKGNAEFLKDSKYYIKDNIHYKFQQVGNTEQLVDNNESITPTTDKGYLDFGLVIDQLKNLQKEAEIINVEEFTKANAIFIKKYQYKDSNTSDVVRFGINLKNKELLTELDIYNNSLKDVKLKIESKKSKDTESIISNISNETNYKAFYTNNISLTTYEKSAIESAINYLNSSPDNKTALVDVFKRESKAIPENKNELQELIPLGGINNSNLDSHTALLYKTTENKILVIDPNNPIFSAHIAKHNSNVILEVSTSSYENFKIYTKLETSVTGIKANNYRDCVDVVVKMAFVLNKDTIKYQTIDEIMKSSSMKLISNNKAFDQISDIQVPNRLKQTSDYEQILECNKKTKMISDQKEESLKKALNEYNIEIQNVTKKYNESKEIIQSNYLVSLTGMSDEYSDYMQTNVDEV